MKKSEGEISEIYQDIFVSRIPGENTQPGGIKEPGLKTRLWGKNGTL